jgi:hypothetical protein
VVLLLQACGAAADSPHHQAEADVSRSPGTATTPGDDRPPEWGLPATAVGPTLISIVGNVGPQMRGPSSSSYYLDASGLLTLSCVECALAGTQPGDFGERSAVWQFPSARFVELQLSGEWETQPVAALQQDRRTFAYWPHSTSADRSFEFTVPTGAPTATVTWYRFVPDPYRLVWRLSDGSFWSYRQERLDGEYRLVGPRQETVPAGIAAFVSTAASRLNIQRDCASPELVAKPTVSYGLRSDGRVVAWHASDPTTVMTFPLDRVVQLSQPTYYAVLALTESGDVYWVNRNEALAPCPDADPWLGGTREYLVHRGDAALVGPGPMRIADLPGRVCALGGDYAVLCSGDVYRIGLSYASYEQIEGVRSPGPSERIDALSDIRHAAMPTLHVYNYRLSQDLQAQRRHSSVFVGSNGVARDLLGNPIVLR